MLNTLFSDKTIKPKDRTSAIANFLLEEKISVADLLLFAVAAKPPVKATCIEGIEFATQTKPELVDIKSFALIVEALKDKEPRVKWESAKVIANTAKLHTSSLKPAISNLLDNTSNAGTVVRWSAATALAAIIQLQIPSFAELENAAAALILAEEKASIQKIYQKALKKKKGK